MELGFTKLIILFLNVHTYKSHYLRFYIIVIYLDYILAYIPDVTRELLAVNTPLDMSN